MKVSEVIKNLEYLQKTYGDLEVNICLEEDDEGEVLTNNLYFATDLTTITIQNVEF